MKRSIGFGVLLALVFATACTAKQGSGAGRGPIIQRTDDAVERERGEHGDLTRPVFGQGN